MPIPHAPIGGQSALEAIAIQQRNKLIPINTYNNAAAPNQYNPTHTRAIADKTTPNYGKGTGNYLDINNYAAGSNWDIFGNQAIAIGSGRVPAFANNASTWGYDPTTNYQHPNTALNVGQVII
jgi:hypothetical protein